MADMGMKDDLMISKENNDFIQYLDIKDEWFKFLKESIKCNLNLLFISFNLNTNFLLKW